MTAGFVVSLLWSPMTGRLAGSSRRAREEARRQTEQEPELALLPPVARGKWL